MRMDLSTGTIQEQGNAFLDREHPKLTHIETARVVDAGSISIGDSVHTPAQHGEL
jgi:hypothetical protein